MPDSPFSPEAIQKAVIDHLNQDPILPVGKSGALIVMATTDGVKAILAAKVGEHWEFDGTAAWHGGEVYAGVSVVASW